MIHLTRPMSSQRVKIHIDCSFVSKIPRMSGGLNTTERSPIGIITIKMSYSPFNI